MKQQIKYLLLSDIHLGHDKNKTENIIKNLDMFFKKYKNDIIKTKIIFISGDIFDRLLSSGSKDTILINNWLSRLVLFCKTYGIKLRILEGTPSHDRKQVKLLSEIIDALGITKEVDYKYFDMLDIEHMEDLDLNILYIPDEWKHTAKEVYEDVKKKMKEYNLDKVDLIIMHGAFKYQIPGIESEAFHNEEDYLKLVKYTINCGHVHDRSQYEKILVPGSFDRLTFADEGQVKGGLLVTLYPNGKFDYKVLENPNPLEFVTIEIDKMDWDKVEKTLDKLNKKEKEIHVKLISDNTNIKNNLFELKRKYPNLKFSVSKTKDKIKDKQVVLENKTVRVMKKLDKDTIKDYVLEQAMLEGLDIDLVESELSNIL